MQFLSGKPRDQLYLIPTSLEEVISSDNEARTLDAFVSMLDLKACGFQFPQGKTEGWSPSLPPFGFVEAVFIRLHEQDPFFPCP